LLLKHRCRGCSMRAPTFQSCQSESSLSETLESLPEDMTQDPEVQLKSKSFPPPETLSKDLGKVSRQRGRSAPAKKDALWNRWHFSLSAWTGLVEPRVQSDGALPELGRCSQPLTLSCVELAKMMSICDPRLVIVDVRDADFFYCGKIPNSWHVASESFPQKMARLVYHCNKPWYRAVFCSFDGVRRSFACAELFQRAVHAVYRKEECCSAFVLKGGIHDWAKFCEAFDFEDPGFSGLEKPSLFDALAYAQDH